MGEKSPNVKITIKEADLPKLNELLQNNTPKEALPFTPTIRPVSERTITPTSIPEIVVPKKISLADMAKKESAIPDKANSTKEINTYKDELGKEVIAL